MGHRSDPSRQPSDAAMSGYKSAEWQEKRLAVLKRDGWKCKRCRRGKGDNVLLHVHHKYYGRGEVWEIPDEALDTLCVECHEDVTMRLRATRRYIGRFCPYDDLARLQQEVINFIVSARAARGLDPLAGLRKRK